MSNRGMFCTRQGQLDIGQPALTRLCEQGAYTPWLDWSGPCPCDYNPRFDAPPPPAPDAGATAQLLDGFPQTYTFPHTEVHNDQGESISRTVRPHGLPPPLPALVPRNLDRARSPEQRRVAVEGAGFVEVAHRVDYHVVRVPSELERL